MFKRRPNEPLKYEPVKKNPRRISKVREIYKNLLPYRPGVPISCSAWMDRLTHSGTLQYIADRMNMSKTELRKRFMCRSKEGVKYHHLPDDMSSDVYWQYWFNLYHWDEAKVQEIIRKADEDIDTKSSQEMQNDAKKNVKDTEKNVKDTKQEEDVLSLFADDNSDPESDGDHDTPMPRFRGVDPENYGTLTDLIFYTEKLEAVVYLPGPNKEPKIEQTERNNIRVAMGEAMIVIVTPPKYRPIRVEHNVILVDPEREPVFLKLLIKYAPLDAQASL